MLTVYGRWSRGLPLGTFTATPGADRPDETIDGFPEFTVTLELIHDPAVMGKLRALAKRIVLSHDGADRIIGFEVHGHADATMRFSDRKEAERTEMEVSKERADNARELLLQLIEQEGGKPIIQGIRANASTKGFGSRHRVFVPATTEPQMKKNRRVEIFLRRYIPPPPRPDPPPSPRPKPQPDIGSHWRMQILGGSVMTFGHPEVDIGSFTIELSVEITDVDRKEKARFVAITTGTSLPGTQAMGAVTVTRGTPTDFVTTRGLILRNFEGSVEIMQDPGASFSVLSVGGNFNFHFPDLAALTRPRAVSVNAGTGFLTPSQAGLGGMTVGNMTMRGAPTPIP